MQGDLDRIKQLQDALTAKGVAVGDYDVIRQDLVEIKQLQEKIASERGEQFYDDAFRATAGMGLTNEMIATVAAYMRQFAEKIATSQAAQNATPTSVIADVVDNVTPKNPTA